MSLLGASGAGATGAKASPLVLPTNIVMTRYPASFVPYGTTPGFDINYTLSTQNGNKSNIEHGSKVYRTSDNLLMRTYTNGTNTVVNTIVAGTEYYGKVYITDTVQNLTIESTATANMVAMTKPSDQTIINGFSNTGGTFEANWTALTTTESGGGTITYNWQLYSSSDTGTTYSPTNSGTTTSTSISLSSIPGGSNWRHYVSIYPSNALGNGGTRTSGVVAVAAPGPYFPYFPYFPFFPYFASSGRRCTSSNRSMGYCFTLNCCCYSSSGCGGATCSPSAC